MAYFQEGCPNYTQRGNLCAIPQKKVKYKVKNQEATNINIILSPKKALSIHTTSSPSQSRGTVPINWISRRQVLGKSLMLRLLAATHIGAVS
jgi:hypothetical protein